MHNEKLCAGCLRDNEENIAETWCSNCSELVCKFCAKVHRRFDPPHEIVQLNNLSEFNFSLIQTSKYCGTHSDQKSVLFCSQHDQSICDLCLSDDHANCKSIMSIERAAKGAKEGTAADDLEKRLKDIGTVARTLLKEVKTNVDSLIKQKSDILQMVSSVRKEIEKRLDELEQNITKEIEKQYNTCQQRVMEQKLVMEKQEKERIDRNTDINSLKLCTNDIQFFQTIKTLDVSTHQYETEMTTKITRISLEYEPNEEIPKLIAALKSFGNVRISETDLELHHVPDKMQQSQVQHNRQKPCINQNVKELTGSILQVVKRLPGNNVCCDCNAKDPEWLSTNLGVLICLECCGIHRQLGVHISRTQSIVIDELGTSQVLLARVVGNQNFNEIVEAKVDQTMKLKPSSPMEERLHYIKAKYEQHKYAIITSTDKEDLKQDLKQAIIQQDIGALIQVYAEGADLMTELPDDENSGTALHLAIEKEDGYSLHFVDFIVQNSHLNSLGHKNKQGNTVLHVCSLLNKTECMKLILRTQPELANVENNDSQTPLDIAKENNHEICIDLLKAALQGRKDVFGNVNVDWDLPYEDGEDQGYSDDDLEKKSPVGQKFQALFDCDADNDDELTFAEGEIILVLREEKDDWWEGTIEGHPERRGLFPKTFVQPLS